MKRFNVAKFWTETSNLIKTASTTVSAVHDATSGKMFEERFKEIAKLEAKRPEILNAIESTTEGLKILSWLEIIENMDDPPFSRTTAEDMLVFWFHDADEIEREDLIRKMLTEIGPNNERPFETFIMKIKFLMRNRTYQYFSFIAKKAKKILDKILPTDGQLANALKDSNNRLGETIKQRRIEKGLT